NALDHALAAVRQQQALAGQELAEVDPAITGQAPERVLGRAYQGVGRGAVCGLAVRQAQARAARTTGKAQVDQLVGLASWQSSGLPRKRSYAERPKRTT